MTTNTLSPLFSINGFTNAPAASSMNELTRALGQLTPDDARAARTLGLEVAQVMAHDCRGKVAPDKEMRCVEGPSKMTGKPGFFWTY